MALSEINSGEALQKLLQNRWLIWLVNTLVVLWLVWLVADAAMPYFRPAAEAELIATTPPVNVTPPQEIKTGQIANWHLFGIASEKPVADVQRILDAPETKLKLTLRGIYATDDRLEGYAIIQKPDKQEKHFSVKDSIFELATLEEIYSDRVIISRKGTYETLTLPEEALLFVPFADKIKKEAEKRSMSTWRKKFLQRKGMDLIKMFGFEQAYKPSGLVGWRIKSLGEEGVRMLETLDLEDGDIITAVNGKRFAESLEAAKSLKDLKTATQVDIEVDRGGVPLFFHLEFDEDDEIEDLATDEPVDTLKNFRDKSDVPGDLTTAPVNTLGNPEKTGLPEATNAEQ